MFLAARAPALHMRTLSLLLGLALSLSFPLGSNADEKLQRPPSYDANIVTWAVNVGGPAYLSRHGTAFAADDLAVVGEKGAVQEVQGAQDEGVYLTYRTGDLQLQKTVPAGTYDLTLYFVEPQDVPAGGRVFDVLVQGRTVIEALDVSLSRSSSAPSALKRTVTGIDINDGNFQLKLHGRKSKPVLSGFVLRPRQEDDQGWRLVWSDEFDYEGRPDPQKWHIDQWPAGKVNDENQAYTDRPDNVRVGGGTLILEAHREDYQGADFTSGRVHTKGLGDFLYGRLDIRARLPVGQGTWSALWMLPSDPYRYATNCGPGTEWQGNPDCDAWPNSGEIDIMEHVGYDRTRVHATVHNQRFFSSGPELRNASVEVPDVTGRFHIYSLEWTPESIRVLVDGVVFYEYLNESRGWRDWPYDHPFHLIMNLAVGGFWGRAGGPIDESIFPASMEVDYVRVFEASPSR